MLKRKEIGVPEESIVLLSVGELNSNKNHEVVIRALAEIKDPNIHYVICGKGPLEEKHKNLSIKLGVKNSIHFLGFRKDIPEICKMSDIFIFPSFREGLSVALMEAMACGLPVICSSIRGNVDLIDDEKGGYIDKPSKISEYMNAILRLVNSEKNNIVFGRYNLNKCNLYDLVMIKKSYQNI